MAAAAKSASTSSARKTSGRKRRTARRDPLAVRLLKQDHREVEGWFDEYEQLEADAEKLELSKFCWRCRKHTNHKETK